MAGIDTTSPHYKGKYASIYEVNVDFPNGGSAGDYVDILGFAHYWNPDRNNWCVNEERDEYWDELLTSAAEGVKRLETELASTREQIEKNTKNIDVNTERLNIEGTQVMTVGEMINFNPLSDDGKSFLAGYLDKPSRYVVTKEVGGVPVNVGILEILSDSSQHVYTQVFTTHLTLDNSGNLNLGSHSDTKLVTYFRSYSIDSPFIDSGTWTKWEDISHSSDILESIAKNTKDIEFLDANTGISEYPEFSESKAYAVGDIVLYEGLLKKYTSAHEAGVWDASQVVAWSEKKERKEEINNLTNNTNNKTYTTSAKANLIIRKIYLDVSGYTGEYELTNLRIVRIAKAVSGKIYGVRISTKNTDEIIGNFWGENVGNKVSFVKNGIYGYFEYNWDNMEGSTLDFYNNPACLTTEAFNPINDPRDSVSIDMLPDKSITRAKLQDDVLKDLNFDNLSQEVVYAINNPSPKDAYRLLPCNTIANINTLSPSMYFLQDDNGDKYNWVKVVNTVDTNSPFANILGTSVVFENNKLGQDVSAYKWEEVGYADAKRTETPKNIKISFWVNVDELTIPNEVSPLFCLATSSVKLFLKFLPWLRVAKKNVGYYEEETHTISGLFTAIIKISQVCAIGQWKQIIWEFSNIEWDLQGAKWMLGMAFNGLTINLTKLTLVNIQIVEDGHIPIGLYTLPDNQGYLGYPNDLTVLRNNIANNKSNIDNILHLLSGDKTNYLYFNKDINETSYLLSDFDDDYLFKLEFIARRAGTLEINPCFNFVSAKLVRKVDGGETLIHNMPDDIAPSNFNSSYIGANHGHSDCRSVTVTSHGKTASDIGSVWANAEGKQITLVGVLDENTLLFFGYNMLVYPKYSFNINVFTSGATFSHVEGATHTGDITLNSNGVLWQFKSAMPTPKLTLIADGIEIHESGEYRFKELNICEDYDILNVASVIEKIKARAGSFTETPNPNTLIDADKVVRHSIIYNFSSAYDWRVITNFVAYQDINLGYFGYTQQSPLNGSINMYIPKTLPISDGTKTIDFRTIVPYNDVRATMNITSEYWESETAVPDRWLQFSPYVGLHSGFMHDYGIGGSKRKELIDNAFYLYTSRKVYPHGIDSKIKVNSGDCYSAVVWRNYIPASKINKNGIISVNQFEYNRAHYIYGDYNQSGVFTINIPPKYVGKPIEILESSSNVSLLSNISTSDLLVKIDENTPMYGYIVMKIEEL